MYLINYWLFISGILTAGVGGWPLGDTPFSYLYFIPETLLLCTLSEGVPTLQVKIIPGSPPLSNCKHVRSHIGVIPLLFISCKLTFPGEKFHTQKVWKLTNMEHIP